MVRPARRRTCARPVARPVARTALLAAALGAALAGCSGASSGGTDHPRPAYSGPTATEAAGAVRWEPHPTSQTCRDTAGNTLVTLSGDQGDKQYRESLTATTVDARTATWTGKNNYPVLIEGTGRGVCLVGATATGTWPTSTAWKKMHDVAAVVVSTSSSTMEDLTLHDYGDAIRVVDGAQGFTIRRVHVSYMRDDCVENDFANSGTIEDSLFDGCYNAFSSRKYDGMQRTRDGSGDLWTIKDTLVRLQPMDKVYKGRGQVPGHAGFFKWDAQAPRVDLVNNVFRADQDANTVGLDIPTDKLGQCSGNVMVWLGPGPYPGALPACFTLTRDKGVWDRAVAAWEAAHPPAS